jgi:Aspartyl protease
VPHFTLTFTQGAPIINIAIMVSAARRAALVAASTPIPNVQSVRGLVDTGASHTCVDPTVLQALQLSPTGSIPMHTPSTGGVPVSADTYDVGLAIPGAPGSSPFLLSNMQVSASDLATGQGIHVLVGRDVLSQFIMTYNGVTGLFMLSY